jgi:hypothetical protein
VRAGAAGWTAWSHSEATERLEIASQFNVSTIHDGEAVIASHMRHRIARLILVAAYFPGSGTRRSQLRESRRVPKSDCVRVSYSRTGCYLCRLIEARDMQLTSTGQYTHQHSTRRHDNEENNCQSRLLRTGCAAGICPDAFDAQKTNNNYRRTNNGNGNDHQNDD